MEGFGEGDSLAKNAVRPSMQILKADDNTADGVQYVPLADHTKEEKMLPTPSVVNRFLRESGWTIRGDWQSSSEIYRVLNDLYTRQSYCNFSLVYLPKMQLVAVLGEEPPEFTEMDVRRMRIRGAPARQEDRPPPEVEVEAAISGHEQPPISTADIPVEPAVIPPHVFVIPGNFTSAKLSGGMRFVLDDELTRLSAILSPTMGIVITAGWIFAITDCDQVCYYVERMLTLEQLVPNKSQSRDEELVSFFGKNRTINVRSLATRRAQKERKERAEEARLEEERIAKAERVKAEAEELMQKVEYTAHGSEYEIRPNADEWEDMGQDDEEPVDLEDDTDFVEGFTADDMLVLDE